MNRNVRIQITKTVLSIMLLATFWGCGEMLDNPLKDKETGEDINILIIDFNFFNTRVTYKLVDIEDKTIITEPAVINFTGSNANDIVTFAGEKKSRFSTSVGQLELTMDPNVEISSETPFTFNVNVEVEGYHKYSKAIQINSEGIKAFELLLTKKSEDETELTGNYDEGSGTIVFGIASETKSASIEEDFNVKHIITDDDLLKFEDVSGPIFSSIDEIKSLKNTTGFASMFFTIDDDFAPGAAKVDGFSRYILFHQLETGQLTGIELMGRTVVSMGDAVITTVGEYLSNPKPDITGFAEQPTDFWEFHGDTIENNTLDFSYTYAKAYEDELCRSGSEITFTMNDEASFSVEADIYDSEGNWIDYVNFKGISPETFRLENLPYGAGEIRFRPNPAFQSIPTIELNDMCSGEYQVQVEPKTSYALYQVTLKAFCPSSPGVALSPTYNCEISIKDHNEWHGIYMEGGVADFFAMPNQDYELRLLFENEYEIANFRTEMGYVPDYLSNSIVTYELLEDRIRINIEHDFEQDICSSLGW
ncbi:MAG: hypothetical protein R3182_08520 [Draconibacterium sp.]|nr:hypothetical protein [Draconibacterium sp.]